MSRARRLQAAALASVGRARYAACMGEASIPADDRGLLLGDGLFETVLFRAGEPVLWDEHLRRLQRGCAALGLPSPDAEQARRACAEAVAEAGVAEGRAAVRLTWTAGSGPRGLLRPEPASPRLIVSAARAGPPPGAAVLATARTRRNAGSIASRLKTLAYLDSVLARREAAQAGADEAVMLDTDGRLASGSAANLFWVAGGALFTPSLAGAVLPGIMRAQVLAARPVREVEAGPEALEDAEAIFLTSSLIGVRPARALDGRALPSHPLVEALAAELAPCA